MTKYLNLDEIAPIGDVRTVVLFGHKYEVSEITVENWIETQRAARDIDPKDELATMEAMVALVSRYLPDAPQKDLHRLPLTKLRTLLDFVTGRLDEQVAGNAAGDQAEGQGSQGNA